MRNLAHWSIRSKLLAILLLLSVTTLATTGTVAYTTYVRALKQGITNQLTGVRRSKASRIETYYRTIHSHVLTLSEDRMFLEAMRDFRSAYELLNAQPIP